MLLCCISGNYGRNRPNGLKIQSIFQAFRMQDCIKSGFTVIYLQIQLFETALVGIATKTESAFYTIKKNPIAEGIYLLLNVERDVD